MLASLLISTWYAGPVQAPHTNPVTAVVRLDWPPPFADKGKQEYSWKGIRSGTNFNIVTPSWNMSTPRASSFDVDMKVRGPGFESEWLRVASVRSKEGQRIHTSGSASDGRFRFPKLLNSVDMRVRLIEGPLPNFDLVTLSVCNTNSIGLPVQKTKDASWGSSLRVKPVKFRDFSSEVLCTASIDGFWSEAFLAPEFKRSEKDLRAFFDMNDSLPTRNVGLVASLAGSKFGAHAYPAHFVGTNDVQAWIAKGIPVTCFLHDPKDGQYAAIVYGFTKSGDPIILRPTKSAQAKAMSRSSFEASWRMSSNAVLLNYLAAFDTPLNSRGQWLERHVAD